MKSKNILIAPLNWGLGHATRCVPIINALQKNGNQLIIASDGAALAFLKKEFPDLIFEILPSYKITYPKNGKNYNWHFLKLFSNIIKAINLEHKRTKEIVKKHNIDVIISDNRLGVLCKKVPSVYITHQVNVLAGFGSWFASKTHQYFIKKHRICWIPDDESEVNLSGKLSHLKKPIKNAQFIGPISRLKQLKLEKTIDILVILSGPEPQRSFLAEKLLSELNGKKEQVVFIEGKVEEKQTNEQLNNIIIYNFMTSQELEITINKSKLVICRAGYTSIMDLAFLDAKCFLIPTPGQKEQEYLAKKLKTEGLVYCCSQNEFRIEKLSEIENYKGFGNYNFEKDWVGLFEEAYK